jgi:hypothetical protein
MKKGKKRNWQEGMSQVGWCGIIHKALCLHASGIKVDERVGREERIYTWLGICTHVYIWHMKIFIPLSDELTRSLRQSVHLLQCVRSTPLLQNSRPCCSYYFRLPAAAGSAAAADAAVWVAYFG